MEADVKPFLLRQLLNRAWLCFVMPQAGKVRLLPTVTVSFALIALCLRRLPHVGISTEDV
ncbi:hypothetical protein PA598K_00414 [Paenibacillus sp. 598K]|nr:hypothetical protein PA598K_00414 [Paenibacillus sp. 598K]